MNIKLGNIYFNNAIDICAKACSVCYDTKLPEDEIGKAKYIMRRVKSGHTSVLEHSNLFITLVIDNEGLLYGIFNIYKDIINFVTNARYLNTYFNEIEMGNKYMILTISGSMRGYIDVINAIPNNSITKFLNNLFNAVGSCTQYSIFLRPDTFLNNESLLHDVLYNMNIYGLEKLPEKIFSYDRINEIIRKKCIELFGDDSKYPEVVNIDSNYIWYYVSNHFEGKVDLTDEDLSKRNAYNIIDMALEDRDMLDLNIGDTEVTIVPTDDVFVRNLTITVKFVNMSRTSTHQLVRHRNAITQQSQRYVDYSNASFTVSNKEFYEGKEYEYNNMKTSFESICTNEFNHSIKTYNSLIGQGVKKEDARALLLNNTNCGEIYMTFNLYNFLKFLELRCDPHAQDEIRKYALALRAVFNVDELVRYL